VKLLWLPQAIAMRDAQLEFVAQDSLNAAIALGDQIERQVGQLLAHPAMGRAGRIKGTRELVISHTPYIVVYRIKRRAGKVELLRLVHSARQWPPV